MKKILVLGLAVLGTFALTGCEMIESIISGEKEYTYDDYKVMLADRKLSFSVTKCSSVIDVDGKQTNREYTYDATDKEWKYTYETEVLGEKIQLESSTTLDVTNFVKKCATGAAILNKKVDQIYKFYASSTTYKITATYKDDKNNIEAEYIFGNDGLISSSNEKSTNLDTIVSTVEKEIFSYSK